MALALVAPAQAHGADDYVPGIATAISTTALLLAIILRAIGYHCHTRRRCIALSTALTLAALADTASVIAWLAAAALIAAWGINDDWPFMEHGIPPRGATPELAQEIHRTLRDFDAPRLLDALAQNGVRTVRLFSLLQDETLFRITDSIGLSGVDGARIL